MADEMVIVQCGKCGAKLKMRAVALKIMKEIKCTKCGNKVSTQGAVPAPAPDAAAAPSVPASAPIAEPAAPPAAPPAPVAPAPAAPPAPTPAPAVAAPSREPELEKALAAAQARAAELEQRVAALSTEAAQARQRVADFEAKASAPAPSAPGAELVEARRTIAEQESRLSELQALWLQKEKESRNAQASATKAAQERGAVMGQIRALLKSYHEAELQAATDRLADLEARIAKFLSGAPPA